jgi:hypothetical protein
VFFENLVGRFAERRQFEVWEMAGAGQPCFMVAAALTRHEAQGVANARAQRQPGQRLLVLDGRGNLVYRI